MANSDRARAILENIAGKALTGQQLTEITQAFIDHYRSRIIDRGWDPDNLSVERKATVLIQAYKNITKDISHIHHPDVQAARDNAETVKDDTRQEIDTNFPDEADPDEAP